VATQLPRSLETYEAYRETATELVRDPAWPSVTPRMLLAHTSGLANFPFVEPDKKMHLHFKPRTQYRYSGDGINLVQFVIEHGMGWGLLTHTRFGPAFFKEGHGDGAQNYMICFERRQACMILLTNSDNGELAFRPLLETILGNTATPWEWEGYTPAYIERSRKQG